MSAEPTDTNPLPSRHVTVALSGQAAKAIPGVLPLAPPDELAARKRAKEAQAKTKESLSDSDFDAAVSEASKLDVDGAPFIRAVNELALRSGFTKSAVEKAIRAKRSLRFDRGRELEDMNRELAVLHEPVGKILYEAGELGYQIAAPRDLEVYYANRPNAPDAGWVATWMAYPGRREHSRIIFLPTPPGHTERSATDVGPYNTWKGWDIAPAIATKRVDISAFWNFMLDTICAGDSERFDWLKNWLAHLVQKPAKLPGTTPILLSKQGTGKDSFVAWPSALCKSHFFTCTSLESVFGHFNAHLSNAVLVFVNEALWGGDKKHLGRMKSLITDPRGESTKKNVDTGTADNFKRWIFASNSEHPVSLDKSDRRFVVFNVAENKINDTEFFGKLARLRENGGLQSFMAELMEVDLTNFSPNNKPESRAAIYKMRSNNAWDSWLQECLERAQIRRYDMRHDCYVPWSGYVLPNIAYDSYVKAAQNAGKRDIDSEVVFRRNMRSLGMYAPTDVQKDPRAPVALDPKRPRMVLLQNIDAARSAFAESMGESKTLWHDGELFDLPDPCEACAQSAKEDAMYGPRHHTDYPPSAPSRDDLPAPPPPDPYWQPGLEQDPNY